MSNFTGLSAFWLSLAEGKLTIGTRTPVQDVPLWATPEVIHGGFATGHTLSQEEKPWEIALGEKYLKDNFNRATMRQDLNKFFCSQDVLGEVLLEQRYKITIPEEAAILTMFYLQSHGKADEAAKIVEIISPYFARFRFYPNIVPSIERSGLIANSVLVWDVNQVIAALETRAKRLLGSDRREIRRVENARLWRPLMADAAALLNTTCAGSIPHLVDKTVVGGWPLQVLDDAKQKTLKDLMCRFNIALQKREESTQDMERKRWIVQPSVRPWRAAIHPFQKNSPKKKAGIKHSSTIRYFITCKQGLACSYR